MRVKLIRLPIFLFVLVFQHAEVGGIAALADEVLLHGFEHGTAWLVGVGAVAILAMGRGVEDLGEVVADLLYLHVEGAKALDAWSID